MNMDVRICSLKIFRARRSVSVIVWLQFTAGGRFVIVICGKQWGSFVFCTDGIAFSNPKKAISITTIAFLNLVLRY